MNLKVPSNIIGIAVLMGSVLSASLAPSDEIFEIWNKPYEHTGPVGQGLKDNNLPDSDVFSERFLEDNRHQNGGVGSMTSHMDKLFGDVDPEVGAKNGAHPFTGAPPATPSIMQKSYGYSGGSGHHGEDGEHSYDRPYGDYGEYGNHRHDGHHRAYGHHGKDYDKEHHHHKKYDRHRRHRPHRKHGRHHKRPHDGGASPVPEPGTLLLAGLAGGTVLRWGKRRWAGNEPGRNDI